MRKALKKILNYLVDNVEELSKDKDSGVHDTNLGYRVHEGSVIPRVLKVKYIDTYDCLEKIVKTTKFSRKVEWDAQCLWLTIEK